MVATHDGFFVTLEGTDGAGKSTALNALRARLQALPAPTPELVVCREPGGTAFGERIRDALLGLDAGPPSPTAEMLAFAGRIKGVPGRQLQQRIEEVSEKTAISDVSTKLVGHLSRGYRQRVGLAAALIHNPEVLVLDEPTAGLDPKQIIETRKLITSLAGEHTIILSTHILSEAANTCGRVMIINAGKLVAEDTPENLTARLQGYETMSLLVEGPEAEARERLSRIPGVSRVSPSQAGKGRVAFSVQTAQGQETRKELAKAVVESGWGLLELRPVGLSLEDIFLKLTTTEPAENDTETDSEQDSERASS